MDCEFPVIAPPRIRAGKVLDHAGVPPPLVRRISLPPEAVIDESVFAAVVYRRVFVLPKEVTPVPPLATARVPVVSESAIPREDVAYPMNVLLGPPMRREDDAIEVRPVPP